MLQVKVFQAVRITSRLLDNILANHVDKIALTQDVEIVRPGRTNKKMYGWTRCLRYNPQYPDEKRTCNNADSVAYFVVSAYLLKQFTAPGTVQGQAQTQGAANAQNPIYMTAVNHEGHIQHVVYDTNKGFDDNYNELKRQLGLQKGPPSSSGSERNSGQNSRSNSPNSGTQGTPSQPPAPAPGKNLATDLGELTIGTTPKGTRKSGRSRSGSQTGGAPKY